jgi:hypothetical protein
MSTGGPAEAEKCEAFAKSFERTTLSTSSLEKLPSLPREASKPPPAEQSQPPPAANFALGAQLRSTSRRPLKKDNLSKL